MELEIKQVLLEFFETEYNGALYVKAYLEAIKGMNIYQEILESEMLDQEKIKKCTENLNQIYSDINNVFCEMADLKEASLFEYRNKYMSGL